jgi:hypothetical protein
MMIQCLITAPESAKSFQSSMLTPKKLEALKIPKQLALSGSASIEVETKESVVSRLNFGAKLSELEWYRI